MHRNRVLGYLAKGAKKTFNWHVGGLVAPLTDGAGAWGGTAVPNWRTGAQTINWVDGVIAQIGGGTAGAAGLITLGAAVKPIYIVFETANGGGVYQLTGTTTFYAQSITGEVYVNAPAGVTFLNTAFVGNTNGWIKRGPGPLNYLVTTTTWRSLSPTITVKEGTLLPNSLFPCVDATLTVINVDFTGTPALANSGRITLPANPTLAGGKPVNIVTTGTTPGTWTALNWTGTATGMGTFQVNGVAVGGLVAGVAATINVAGGLQFGYSPTAGISITKL